ncbi:adenylate/guanylate cyclase domain-containing protein [Bradyrhizobium guangdongense]|uniref:adenylate/guanylate cyclase domain-containing protein n=1 Tax=Bradyrhizobium guangdongense TaxID=1325090 RepID=UPI0032DFD58F
MQCWRCSFQNKTSNEYCENCGSALAIRCRSCGHASGSSSRYCGRCGSPLSPPDMGDTNRPWQQVLRSLYAKGGERKRLTILFADIRNSTGLIDSLGDPELGMKRLQPILDLMNKAVARYDGVVNKSQGDGVMALFGAPQPHEDHPIRGCLAALAMQDGVKRLGDPDLQIRVGVHTGDVVVQAIEHSLYQTFDAAGASVHLANRLEQLAGPGEILISKDTYTAARQFIEVEPLGAKSIRGIAAPMETYKIIGLQHAPASGVFREGRRLSSLIGRADQLSTLLVELENTIRSEGRVVGVVGEAGIGKSRLCFEFAENCRARGIRVFEARVLDHGKETPFQPVLELLRDYFGVRVKETAEACRRRVLERLSALSLPEAFSAIMLEFLGLADPSQTKSRVDPKTRKTLLLDFVRTLPRSGPQETANLVLIEDLHWIDAASLEFVEALADGVYGTTTLLVVNFRPGFTSALTQRSHYRQVNMLPLPKHEATTLVLEHFGPDPSLALIGRNIIERAQGNPFFLEELINTLVERGDFEGEKGAYRLKGGIDSVPLPTTVQAVVAARIDRLQDAAKQVLEMASVVGREVSIAILEDLDSGLSGHVLSDSLQQLRQAELLYDVPPFERRLLAFRHPLIQEVAYRSLLIERRRKLHAGVANAIERLFKEQADERASLLAYHLEQAGEIIKAAQQNMRAAFWVGTHDPSQALRSWKKVRELLLHQPKSAPTDFLKMAASGQIVNFGWREGMSAVDAAVYFNEAKDLARSSGDMRSSALIHAAYGRILANGGSADEYVRIIREAKTLADEAKDPSVQITLKAVLCHALWLSGHLPEALQMNLEALDRAHEIIKFDRQTLGFDIEIWLAALRGRILVVLNRLDEARPFLERVLHLDSAQVDQIHHVMPSMAYVDVAWVRKDVVLAQQHADRAFSIALKSGNPYLRVYAQACRGLAQIVAGSFTSAIEDLSDALNFARSRKAGLENEPRILADLANAYRLSGESAAALFTAEQAIAVATERHARVAECSARIVRASLLLQSENDDQQADGKAELGRAAALMQATGAMLLETFLNDIIAETGSSPRVSVKAS